MFHSKLTGKKKLCLDANVVIEDKSYKSDFIYSFKIEKHYFNVAQLDDKYDLRIDNRSFDIWMHEERSGRLKSSNTEKYRKEEKSLSKEPVGKSSTAKNVIYQSRRSVGLTASQKRNSDDDFFNETDFNFETANINHRHKNNSRANDDNYGNADRTRTNIRSFADFNNEFSSSINNNNERKSRKNANENDDSSSSNKGQLLDINDIIGENRNGSRVENREIFKNLEFSESKRESINPINMDIYNHNKNVLNNINLNNISEEPFNPIQEGYELENPNNQFNNLKQMNLTRTSMINLNNTINPQFSEINEQATYNNSRGFVNKPINNYNQEIRDSNHGFYNRQSVEQYPRNNSIMVNPTTFTQVLNNSTNDISSSKTQIKSEDVKMNSFKVIHIIKLLETTLRL